MCLAVVNPTTTTPVDPNHGPIFKGLPLLGAAMAWKTDKKAALPGLPPPEEDDVLEFEPSAVTEHRDDGDHEQVNRHQAHGASDDQENGKISNIFRPVNPR